MYSFVFWLLLYLTGATDSQKARSEILLADFEKTNYEDWKTTGEAFGPGPAQGTLPGQMAVSGFRGKGLVNSFFKGDGTTGTLTSPPFVLSRRYINFLVGGGKYPGETCINLRVDGKTVRTATGPNDKSGGSERLDWQSWNVNDLQGKTAVIEIVDRATGGWGHINVDHITMSDETKVVKIKTDELYNETYRPQFHFTAQKNWLNDPNGMVYYKGEYHLFFQYNPLGTEWGNMTWGHAISRDLVHWKQLPNALERDALGTMFSGSAVVDTENTAGFATGKEKTLVALYTAAGGTSPESQGKPFTQCLAYSTDRGRTWTKYAGNPVLPHIVKENRDPKVIWHAPTKRWIMALYLDGRDFALFSSPDLKTWERLQTLTMPGCDECPDFFPLRVQGEPKVEKWIFTAANGYYLIGDFDGKKFTPETAPLPSDQGANFYAVQTYSDIPASDGRRIQIAWMRGGSYPQMPFNQQMSFPCELTLRRTPEGLRLFRWPVKEIRSLYTKEWKEKDVPLRPDANPLSELTGDLWDIEAEFELGEAQEVGFSVRGEDVVYRVKEQTLSALGRSAPLKIEKGRVRLRILADRTSLEIFGNSGAASLSSCFTPHPNDLTLAVFARGGTATLRALRVRSLRSAWKPGT
jgi:fructan beta-fructosidase